MEPMKIRLLLPQAQDIRYNFPMKVPLLLCMIFILLTSTAIAQETGLSLSPSLTEIISKPGNTSELSFALENLGDPALVSLKIQSFAPSDYFGNIKFKSTVTKPIEFSLKDYSLSTQKSFIMKTHERKKLSLTISIPEDTTEGDYYYSLVAQTDPPPGQEGKVVARASIAIVSNILISVAQQYESSAEAKIVLFDIPQSYIFNIFGKKIRVINSSLPFSTILTVENKGIHRIKPHGNISVKSTRGNIQTQDIPPQNILAQWQRTFAPSLSIKKLNLGFYTLETMLIIPATPTTLHSSLEFIALPFTFIKILTLTVFLLIMIIFLRKRKKDPDFESE